MATNPTTTTGTEAGPTTTGTEAGPTTTGTEAGPTTTGRDAGSTSDAQLRRAAIERLKYEQSLGLETVRAVKIERPAEAPAAPEVRPVQAKSEAPATPPAAPLDKQARWAAVEAMAKSCTKCALHKGRTNVVFGTGNREAQLVFVGEGPGFDEDQQGLPFVGKAGQLLNKIIAAMGLKREDVYICNVVKCRPPENRTPLPDEIAACNAYLVEQIDLIAPKVIVALGSPAAKTLLKTSQGIMSLRGKWFTYRGIAVMPTYHPAFLLRQYTEDNRRAVWEDMKKVMEKLKSE